MTIVSGIPGPPSSIMPMDLVWCRGASRLATRPVPASPGWRAGRGRRPAARTRRGLRWSRCRGFWGWSVPGRRGPRRAFRHGCSIRRPRQRRNQRLLLHFPVRRRPRIPHPARDRASRKYLRITPVRYRRLRVGGFHEGRVDAGNVCPLQLVVPRSRDCAVHHRFVCLAGAVTRRTRVWGRRTFRSHQAAARGRPTPRRCWLPVSRRPSGCPRCRCLSAF